MYEEFYGLRELPFELTPNPKFLFLSPQHREALSNLQLGVQAPKSLTLLIGEPGTGKTTLLRALMRGLHQAGAYFVCINNPRLNRPEFLQLLASGFGLGPGVTASKATLLQEIERTLKAHTAAGRFTALVVDEAQSMSDELLEELRLLANIETDSTKLLPVILAGHRALADRLNQKDWWQLKQRVSLRCELQPLDLHGTAAYIQARIRAVGGACHLLFTRQAVELIHERSRGIPRVINILCDNALIGGFAAQSRPVKAAIVQEICSEFELGLSTAQAGAKTDLPGSFEIPEWVGRSADAGFDWGPPEEAPVRERAARRFLFF